MYQKQVDYKCEDRQWDARFNVQSDEYLRSITDAIRGMFEAGKLEYVLIGGIEIGEKSTQSDYGIPHIHVAAIFVNRISKASILRNWKILEGNGYYLVPRNRDLPYSGWRNHHTKELTKVDPDSRVVYEAGKLPKDIGVKRKVTQSDTEKKETTGESLKKIRKLLEEGKDDEAFDKYPTRYTIYGERLKSQLKQRKPDSARIDPHIWLWGFPGTGKTQVFELLYPDSYKKDLNNRFWDLYDPKVHGHARLEDVDHATVDKLGIQFLKTACDGSFPIDQKYKSPQLANTTVLVTSNFRINDVVPEGKGVDETKEALHRRFMEVCISDFLRLLGLKLIPPWERTQLQKRGNNDPSAVFMDWDYVQGMPTGLDIKTPEQYRQIIRDYKYGPDIPTLAGLAQKALP